MIRLPASIAAVAALCALTAGCASPPSRFYTLSGTLASGPPSLPQASPRLSSQSGGLSVAVGPVSIPAQVDRPEIVVSAGPNQVRLDETNRWASPLQDNIARVVTANLIALLGTPQVTLFPQTAGADAAYRVSIEVQEFASAPGEAATLEAVWSVRRTQDGRSDTGRTSVREPVADAGYEALAAAHSRALAALSRDIAAALRTLSRGSPLER